MECANLYYAGGYGPSEIEVEIFYSREVHYNISQVLGDDPEVLEALRQVGQVIIDEVRRFCRKGWSSIAFHRRSRLCASQGEATPTVLVIIREGFRADFSKLEYQLLQIFAGLRISIKLEILIGSITATWSVHEKPITYWSPPPEHPTNRCSIGVRGDTDNAGTLGGWLMLSRPGCPLVKVGLTCHHLVANSPAGLQEIDYPAALDLNNSIKNLEALSTKPDFLPHHLNTLDKLELMAKNEPIGRVVASSGKRLNAAGRKMDWALIPVVGDKIRNYPSSPANLHPKALFPEGGKACYEVNPDSLIRKFGTVKKDSWVIKNGRTTGVSSAIVNDMGRVVSWENEDIESVEMEVFGLASEFIHYGDSGSFVVDRRGALVGLLIGMDSSASSFGAGFVTPIAAIQADVKLMTNGLLSIDL